MHSKIPLWVRWGRTMHATLLMSPMKSRKALAPHNSTLVLCEVKLVDGAVIPPLVSFANGKRTLYSRGGAAFQGWYSEG